MPLTDSSGPFLYGIDPKLASALADPVRARILEELQSRPLSPSQFVKEKGGDLNCVARNFRYLKTCGYAEVVEERPRARRGASVEHVYGPPQSSGAPAPWEGKLPRVSLDPRVSPALSSYWSRILRAVADSTVSGHIETHCSWDTLVLDECAGAELRQRLNDVVSSVASSGIEGLGRGDLAADLIPATVGFSILRSPQPPEEIVRRFKPLPQERPKRFEFGPEVANALANPWRAKILTELYSRPISPSQFVEKFGGDPSYVARCFRELSGWGLIELIEEKGGGRNGGGIERIFRNAQHCHFDRAVWATVPRFLRMAICRSWASVFGDRLDEIIEAGAWDEEFNRVDTQPAALPARIWQELSGELDRILDWLPRLQSESIDRAGGDIARLDPTLVSMAYFESPGR